MITFISLFLLQAEAGAQHEVAVSVSEDCNALFEVSLKRLVLKEI